MIINNLPAPATLEPPSPWLADALCAQTDPEAFHPAPGGSAERAKTVCAACPVRAACLAHALTHNERGIWGGTTDNERRQIRRRGEAPARPAPRPSSSPLRPTACGTFPGYRKHRRHNTTPCAACREAARHHWTQERIRYTSRTETTS